MHKHRIWRNLVMILVFTVFLSFTVNPWKFPEMETDIPLLTDFWNWMQGSEVSLGLDLQGGTQLDYEIDLSEARSFNNDDDPDNDINIPELVDGVKDVIERRVNSLGVSEPNIYLSAAGEEQHIVVELPGIEDISDAKDKVGKVVQLEFKTEKDVASDEDKALAEENANAFLQQAIEDADEIEDLEAYAEDLGVLEPGRVLYYSHPDNYLDQVPADLQDIVTELEPGQFDDEARFAQEAQQMFLEGRVVQPEGYNVVRLIETNTDLRKSPVNAEPFEDVMAELGQEPDEEYYHTEDLSEDIELDVISLEPGQVSGVIDTADGLQIIKMTNRLGIDDGENGEPEPQIRTAHILFKTETAESLREITPLKEIAEDATEEERAAIEEENAAIEARNADARELNAEIEARNAPIIEANQAALEKAEEILAQLKEDPSLFEELARENSEDASADAGGDLGYAPPSRFVEPYSNAALELEKGAFTQELVQSQFGYHIIKLIDRKEVDEEIYQFATIKVCHAEAANCESDVSKADAEAQADELLRRVREETTYSIERLWFNASPDPWEKTELDGRYFQRADVAYDQVSFRPYVLVQFNDEGAQLFEDLTEANIGKRLGIFVGGEFISAPVVNERIAGGQAQISMGTPNVQVALQEANELARSLNAGSIPAPLKKPNELNIGASLGADSLQKSIDAGLLGLVLVCVFMLLYYRMLGLLATLSLGVYGLFLTFVIQSQMPPGLAITMTFVFWCAFALRLFRSKLDGLAKAVFLLFSVIGVLFVFSVLVNPIVMTLAGIAGLILSIGMAVDANILIFERIKEEFHDGKSFLASVNDGFERAWTSILDSNVSSLITCAILFFFGTSIIKGFAINLAAGIVISMFTAIVVTKTFILIFEGTKLEEINWIWKRKGSDK